MFLHLFTAALTALKFAQQQAKRLFSGRRLRVCEAVGKQPRPSPFAGFVAFSVGVLTLVALSGSVFGARSSLHSKLFGVTARDTKNERTRHLFHLLYVTSGPRKSSALTVNIPNAEPGKTRFGLASSGPNCAWQLKRSAAESHLQSNTIPTR